MIKISVKNFQSIKDISFSIDGFTTLIGRNFIGKSAVLRAINAALTNQQGTDFIRWGEKFCEVTIETKDLSILWHKEKGNNFYDINNKKYNKIGSQPPPKELLNQGYGLIDISGEKINLLYAQQFFPLFLVDRNDSKSADFLISIYGLDRLYKAVDLCEKDRKKSNNILKIRKGDKEIIENELKRFEGFDDIQDKFKNISKQKKSIESEENKIDYLNTIKDKIISKTLILKRLKPLIELKIPVNSELKSQIEDKEKLSKYLEEIKQLKNNVQNLSSIKKINIPADTIKNYEKELKKLLELKKKFSEYEILKSEINKLKNIVDIKIPQNTYDYTKIDKLKNLYQKLSAQSAELKKLKEDLNNTDQQITEVSKQLEKYNRCPVCKSELKK